MTATIVNAAPMTQMLGVQDLSPRQQVMEPEALPQHLPKFYLYTKKGPTTPQLVVGASRSAMYGDESFDLRKKWANHATVFSNAVNKEANAQMIERIEPADAGPPASIRLWLDVLPCQVPEYERNSDGSIKINDTTGMPVETGNTIAGYKAKWVVDQVQPDRDGNDTFGAATQAAGDMVDATSGSQSVRYPILDTRAPYFGSDGNNQGLRLWAPTIKSTMPIDDRLLTQEKVYPIRMACVARADEKSTPKVVNTLFAEQFVNVCLKPDTIDRSIDKVVYAGDVFIQSYQNLTDPKFPPVYGPFGEMKLYDDVIASLLDMFYLAEKPYIDGFSDFTGEDGEEYRFNMISGMSSHAVPYHSFQLVTGAANSVRLTENTTVYAQGGSDGTMTDELFAGLVADAVREYADENSVLQDTAKYPESIIYDSGFPIETKKALCSFIAIRKDTAVALATHTVGERPLTASEESSLAIALRTFTEMYPESEYFGTSVVRAIIVGRCGTLMNSQYRKKLPVLLEIAVKSARYMGASDGKWKSVENFDMAPKSQLEFFTDVNVTFTPATVKNKDWANGLNWVESYDRSSYYFPALKTVYNDDTSVLTSFFTMMACVECEKVGERARRRFSGTSSLTNAQLVERVNKFVDENTTGRFDGRFIIKPDAYFTQADIARGFSWTLPIKVYAPNMKTVATLSIQAYRIEDLQQ